jgi:hypothetical protein
MDAQRLKKLRATQFILINSYTLVGAVLFTLIICNYSLAIFQRVMGVIILGSVMINMISKTSIFNILRIFPSMRELMRYEAEKLGKEYRKMKWTQLAAQLFVGIMLLIQSFQQTPQNFKFTFHETLFFLIPLLLILAIGTNIGLIYHVKKIDQGTTDSLKGYNKKAIIIGLAIGISISILVIVISILTI